MRLDQFTSLAPGRVVQIPEPERWAFVPDPLPPMLDLDAATLRELSEADRALGELAGVARRLVEPLLLIRPFLHREAVLSSRIEGTRTTVEQLMLFEAGAPQKAGAEEVREVSNYVRTMEYGLKRLTELPVSLRFIRELHEHLMQGVRGQEQRPGELRNLQNRIARRDQPAEEARFVPPPVNEMHEALNAFEHFLAENREFPPLVHLALSHYQFEAIHPFRDGNGRIGRLLIALLLGAPDYYVGEPLLPGPLLYLSEYFDRHRQAYYDHLLHVSQQGKWQEWVRFFLRGVTEQSRDAIQRSQRLLELRNRYRAQIQQARASALLPRLVDKLFATPFVTVPEAQRYLVVTPRSATLNVNKLVALGILKEVTGRARNRVFLAPEILDIIREEPLAGTEES